MPSAPTATREPPRTRTTVPPARSRIPIRRPDVTTYPFPFGFDPQEATHETDYSVTAGFKGVIAQWNWDLSSTYGGDKPDIYTLEFRQQRGLRGHAAFPTPVELLRRLPADHAVDFDARFQSRLRCGHGGAAERGLSAPSTGVTPTASAPAFRSPTSTAARSPIPASPPRMPARTIAATKRCTSISPTKPIERAAGRCRRPATSTTAISAARPSASSRRAMTSRRELAVRGTVSNGFRAPTLAEEYYSSTNVTSTSASVQLPPNSPGGRLLGLGNGLQPEHSVNLSLGLVWRPTPGVERDTGRLPDHDHQPHRRPPATSTARSTASRSPRRRRSMPRSPRTAISSTRTCVATGTTGVATLRQRHRHAHARRGPGVQFPQRVRLRPRRLVGGSDFNQTSITRVPGDARTTGRD